jgi:hypothetical protein
MAALASHDSVSKRYSVHTCMQHDQFDHIPHFNRSEISPRILKSNPLMATPIPIQVARCGDSARDTQNEMHLKRRFLDTDVERRVDVKETI